ncbi:hypothetical protein HKX48_002011 [Thoreauomyces humboldtii]|nr:hypothetical protein HKX48_002011 [Thoreauomyces humboldtii]
MSSFKITAVSLALAALTSTVRAGDHGNAVGCGVSAGVVCGAMGLIFPIAGAICGVAAGAGCGEVSDSIESVPAFQPRRNVTAFQHRQKTAKRDSSDSISAAGKTFSAAGFDFNAFANYDLNQVTSGDPTQDPFQCYPNFPGAGYEVCLDKGTVGALENIYNSDCGDDNRGNMQCAGDHMFSTCAQYGWTVTQFCGQGTTCQPNGNAITCGWPAGSPGSGGSCSSNGHYDNDQSKCVCDDGYTWNGSACVGGSGGGGNNSGCSANGHYDNDQGKCVCNDGYNWNGSACTQ